MKLFKYIIPSFIIFLLFGFFSSVNAAGPVLDWAKGAGSTGADVGLNIKQDGNGNTYVMSIFTGTVDFDPGDGAFNLTSQAADGVAITKFDINGDFVWAKQTGGNGQYIDRGNGMFVDTAGNIYITGGFTGTADFDPGAGTSNLTSTGAKDIFISKWNLNGDFVWVKQIGSTGDDWGAVIIASATNLYVTGNYYGTANFNLTGGTSNLTSGGSGDIFVAKYDLDAELIWAKSFESDTWGNWVHDMVIDNSGNIYTTGTLRGTTDYDPGVGNADLISSGSYDTFVSKLNSSGDFVWAKQITGVNVIFGWGIFVDSSSNVYVTGSFQNTADFDPSIEAYNLTTYVGSDSNTNAYILKLNSSGDFVWAKQIGDNGGAFTREIILDTAGSIYVSGAFFGTVDFDPNSGVYNLTSDGLRDSFLLKLDSSGDFVWANKFGGTGADEGYNVYVDSSDTIYLTGYFSTTVDFDPNAGTTNLTSNGSTDIFILKLSIDSTAPTFTLNTPTPSDPTSINITWSTNENSSSIVEYGTTTNYGSTTAETDTTTGTTTHNVTLSNLTACTTYYYRVKSNDLVSNLGTSSNGTFRTPGCAAVSTVILQALSDAMRSGTINTPTPITQPQTPSNTVLCTGNDLFNPNTGERCTTYTNNTNTKFLFNINLKYKDNNNDVKELQKFLNTNGYTVSTTGPGSLNNETTYFGPATLSAVIKYQKAKNITPAVGYFGPLTRASVNN